MALATPVYPVSLVVADRDCLVVGGGPVAARKVGGLLDCGARVTVVAPRVVEAIRRQRPLVVENRPYRPPEAARYQLVITATGIPEVDGAVSSDARRAGVWVNSADDTGNCSFLLPAVSRRGSVTVAVSTGGASPALAVWVRTRVAQAIEQTVGADLALVAELLDETRTRVKAAGRSTESYDWASLLDHQVIPLVRAGHVDAARRALRAAVAV